jgi:hypothetical protein
MSGKCERYDLYTFVAGVALERGEPFKLHCNCGGVVTIMPPFQEEYVICPRCESKIHMIVLEGDPGYVIGATAGGEPTLLPVQGSSAPHPSTLSPEKREALLSDIKSRYPKKKE